MHVNTDKYSDRNRHTDSKRTPRAVMQSINDNNGHTCHSQDVKEEYGKRRYQTDTATHLVFSNFGNGFTVITHRCKKNNHVMNTTG